MMKNKNIILLMIYRNEYENFILNINKYIYFNLIIQVLLN